MGKTVIEKIIARHSREEVAPGKVVWVDIDLRTARDFGGANVVEHLSRHYDKDRVANFSKTFFTFDCVAPANNIPYANNQQICRVFAQQQGIKVFDVDQGIGSHLLIDKGLCLPGYIAVGTDSHFNILGALGALGQGMGDVDIAFAFKTGKTWFEVPETIKVVVKGKLFPPLSSKDLTLAILKRLGSKGALGKAIEFCGEAIESLSLDGRITLTSMVTEMGGIAGFITPDHKVLDYCRARSGRGDIEAPMADPNAHHCQTIEVDITGLKPQISLPYRPSNVVDVEEVEGEKIDSVFLGSCTNGRWEDFKAVASLLKGKRVFGGVMFKAVPATKEVYGRLLREGLTEVLFDAGVILNSAGCGGCASGQVGMTGEGEVQLSTGNRNFKGKQGAGKTFLVSPATAAASALYGKITSPVKL